MAHKCYEHLFFVLLVVYFLIKSIIIVSSSATVSIGTISCSNLDGSPHRTFKAIS